MNNTEVKTMLALFVPEGYTAEWANQQMMAGGFDKSREITTFDAYRDDSDECYGVWLMQEVISKVH